MTGRNFVYQKPLPPFLPGVAALRDGVIDPAPCPGRLVLRGGRVIDPANGVDAVLDVAIAGETILTVAADIKSEKGDAVVNCEGLQVWPGLIDMHLHIHDLFEVTTDPAVCAAEGGVTTALSPGAGNTFMAPALLGAEVDRGFPLNAGLYLGAAAALSSMLDDNELVAMLMGELPPETAAQKMTRNPVVNQTAPLVMGLKEHMGHALLCDDDIRRLYDITSRAKRVLMSHTQDVEHTLRIADLSAGRPLHLGHATAAGCGPNGAESFKAVRDLCKEEHISIELVTTMLRADGGSREGLRMHPAARLQALDLLAEGMVDVLVSDGQNQATMKGFGDTRDNIPAILELAAEGVLSLSAAVATMTANPARLLAKLCGAPWWQKELGNLSPGTRADITVVNPARALAVYTIVGGSVVVFENRLVRRGWGAGRWVCAAGMVPRMGVGDITMWAVAR
jgi:imidazolonepropionase-like amidohydrolase